MGPSGQWPVMPSAAHHALKPLPSQPKLGESSSVTCTRGPQGGRHPIVGPYLCGTVSSFSPKYKDTDLFAKHK